MKKSNWLILLCLLIMLIGLFTYKIFFKNVPQIEQPPVENENVIPNDKTEEEKPIENYVIEMTNFKKGETTTNYINFYFDIESLNIPIEDIVTMFVYAPNMQTNSEDLICRYYEEMGSVNDTTGKIEYAFNYNYQVNRNFLIMFEYENMYFEITTKNKTIKTLMYDMSNIEDLINDKYVSDIYFDLVIN